MNEADTCRTYVIPKLKSAGWEDDRITEQLVLTPGRIVPIGDEQILPLSKALASPHLNIGSLRKFKFILPPLDEQRRIVAYLDGLQAKVNALRELQSASGEELSALMPSILDKAFKGEL